MMKVLSFFGGATGVAAEEGYQTFQEATFAEVCLGNASGGGGGRASPEGRIEVAGGGGRVAEWDLAALSSIFMQWERL